MGVLVILNRITNTAYMLESEIFRDLFIIGITIIALNRLLNPFQSLLKKMRKSALSELRSLSAKLSRACYKQFNWSILFI